MTSKTQPTPGQIANTKYVLTYYLSAADKPRARTVEKPSFPEGEYITFKLLKPKRANNGSQD